MSFSGRLHSTGMNPGFTDFAQGNIGPGGFSFALSAGGRFLGLDKFTSGMVPAADPLNAVFTAHSGIA